MLESQRAEFDIPRDVGYFNAAGTGPLPLATQHAARRAVSRKAQPWLLDASFADQQHDRARRAAAQLIGADPADVALVSSVGYGVALAGKILDIPKGSRVLVLENDHTSPVLEWMVRAPEQGFAVDVVPQPADGDWTASVLATIARPQAPPISLASISSIHWSDGGLLDLRTIQQELQKQGARLLVDATHSVGVMATDVRDLDPDFLIFPTYKWVLGPYGRAFVYIARRHQNGVPLEQTSFGRRNVRAENDTYFADLRYVNSASRFDMGERDHFISMEMAAVGMEMMAEWGAAAVAERLGHLTREIASQLADCGVTVLPEQFRCPHILGVKTRGDARAISAALAAERIYVMPRLGRIRISPHVYNDEEDVSRLVTALRKLAQG